MSATFVWLIAALGVVFLSVLIGQSVWRPLKWVGYALFKITAGGILLFIFNAIGGYYQFTIPINPVTAACSGFLGIPGLITLSLIKAYLLV